MLEKVIHKIALTCKEATSLMELDDAHVINSFQKTRLVLHLKICKYCRIYNKKRVFISDYLRAKGESYNSITEDSQQMDKLKVAINKKLNLQQGESN